MSTATRDQLQKVMTCRILSRMTPEAVSKAVSLIDFTIGENVNTLRARAGLTKAQLGERFGLSPSAMSLKLSGQRAWSAVDVQDAARLFRVRMAVLTGEETLPEPAIAATISDFERARSRKTVGPGRFELPTSTVESEQFAEIIPIFGRAA